MTNEDLRSLLRNVVMKRAHEIAHELTPFTDAEHELFEDAITQGFVIKRLEAELEAARSAFSAAGVRAVDALAAAHGVDRDRLCVHMRGDRPDGWHVLPDPVELAATNAEQDIAALAASEFLPPAPPDWAVELAEKMQRGEA